MLMPMNAQEMAVCILSGGEDSLRMHWNVLYFDLTEIQMSLLISP